MLSLCGPKALGRVGLSLLLGACVGLVVPAAGAAGEPETAADLVQALVAREQSLQDLRGYLLDRSYLSPWAATARGPVVRTVVIGGQGAHAGTPAPPEPEERTYGLSFGEFVLGPACSRYDMLVLRANEEKLWEIGEALSLTMASAGGADGGLPQMAKPRFERVVVLQREEKLEFRRASPQGSMGVTVQGGEQGRGSALQQPPLADLLFGMARPTLGLALQVAADTLQIGGPETRDEQEQYRLTGRFSDPVSEWQVWVCPAWGCAPTEITQWQNPAQEKNLPLGTQRLARRWLFSDFRELAEGLWLPHQVVFFEFFYSPHIPEGQTPLARIHEIRLYGLEVNTQPNPATWQMPAEQVLPTEDELAALQATFPALAEHQDWLAEAAKYAEDPQMPEPPEDLLNWVP